MEISMDGLRKRLIEDYNLLVKRLNESIDDDEIQIKAYSIQRQLDGIRNAIVVLAFMYDKNDKEFNSMDENTHFETFNEQI
ncbi:MAG: hypothetical protein ACOVNU_04115 [Candidatus Kapaibacteriota bacterium]